MERVLTELPPECEVTARMYAQGYEKKEIANIKCRAVSTINNQLQKAFEILRVRNGRELATMLYERMSGMSLSMDLSPVVRSVVACCLLLVLCLDGHIEMSNQRSVNRIRTNIELTSRVRMRARARDVLFLS